MKKLLSLILVTIIAVLSFGCTSKTAVAVEDLNVPTFKDDKKMVITAEIPPDFSVRANLEQFIAAGLNTIVLGEEYHCFGSEEFYNVMNWCDELGIDVIIRINEKALPIASSEFDGNGWPTNQPTYFETYVKDHTKSTCKSKARPPVVNGKVDEQYLEAHEDCPMLNFRDFPAIIGFFILDEPSYKQLLEVEAHYVDWFNKYYANDYIWLINFTSTDKPYLDGHDNEGKQVTYDRMLTYYMENIFSKVKTKYKIHMIDTYPLHLENGRETTRDNWLKVLRDATIYGKTNQAYFASCIQAFEGYSTVRMPQSTADIDFLNYVNFAFGCKYLEYFGYREASEGGGVEYTMMTQGGKPNPVYYYVQESNAKISKFDHVILHFNKWDGIYTFVGTGNKTAEEECFDKLKNDCQPSIKDESLKHNLSNLDGVKSFKSKYNCIAGQLQDEQGNKAFVVVNYDNRVMTRTNKVKIQFKKADGVLVYRDGEPTVMGLAGRTFEIELKNKEGVVVIPLYKK
jgi:hypothetical protein